MATDPRGWEHQQTKERLLPYAYHQACPRCGEKMLPGQDLDLGHTVDLAIDPNSKADRIEHADCNRSAGAKAQAERGQFDRSRDWW